MIVNVKRLAPRTGARHNNKLKLSTQTHARTQTRTNNKCQVHTLPICGCGDIWRRAGERARWRTNTCCLAKKASYEPFIKPAQPSQQASQRLTGSITADDFISGCVAADRSHSLANERRVGASPPPPRLNSPALVRSRKRTTTTKTKTTLTAAAAAVAREEKQQRQNS